MYLENKIQEEMKAKHKLSLKGLSYLIEKSEQYLTLGEMPDNDLSHVTLFFLAKFHKTLLAVRELVISGFEEDARILLRTLVEELLSLVYISSSKTEERIKLFYEYQYILRYRSIDKIDKHYSKENVSDERRQEIIENYNRVKKNYPIKSRWCDKNLKTVAEEIGTDAMFWYDIVYGADSSYVHSDISSSKEFFKKDGSLLQVVVGPWPFDATDVISKVAEITREMLNVVAKNWSLSTDDIKEIWEKAEKLIVEEFEK